jgi:EpsI family protein
MKAPAPASWRASEAWLALPGLALIALYAPLFPPLVREWAEFPSLSHGFAIPVIAGALVWARRHRLRALPITPTPWGLPLLALGLAQLVVGVQGREPFIARMSLPVTLLGLTLFLGGARIARELALGIAYLAFMVPLPWVTLKLITYRSRLLDAAVAGQALAGLGVPVFREGVLLHLPNVTLEVADECSSIPAVAALVSLGVAYAALSCRSRGRRLVLVAATLPFAIASNIIRIITTAAAAYYVGPWTLHTVYHQFNGTVNFLLTFLLLLLLDSFLGSLGGGCAPLPNLPPGWRRPSRRSNVRFEVARGRWSGEASRRLLARGRRESPRRGAPPPFRASPQVGAGEAGARTVGRPLREAGGLVRRLAVSSLVAVALLAAAGALAFAPTAATEAPLAEPLWSLPAALGAWRDAGDVPADMLPSDPHVQDTLRAGYRRDGDTVWVAVGHYADTAEGSRPLAEELLFPGRGWTELTTREVTIPLEGARSLPANLLVTRTADRRVALLYWWQIGAGSVASDHWYRTILLYRRLLRRPAGAALVRVAAAVPDAGDPAAAVAAATAFIRVFYPELLSRFARRAGR